MCTVYEIPNAGAYHIGVSSGRCHTISWDECKKIHGELVCHTLSCYETWHFHSTLYMSKQSHTESSSSLHCRICFLVFIQRLLLQFGKEIEKLHYAAESQLLLAMPSCYYYWLLLTDSFIEFYTFFICTLFNVCIFTSFSFFGSQSQCSSK